MARSHDKDHFYKFMSCDTAKIVLETSSLRWSKPSQFNDPFDHQVSFQFPYSKEEFSSALATKLEQLVYGKEPNFVVSTLLSKMVLLLRSKKDIIPKEKVISTIIQGCEESGARTQDYRDDINSFMNASINQSRVLCVTEHSKNVVMWSHYADSHKGICLRLQCIDEIDNALLAAEPVTYTDSFPVLLELEEQICYLTGEHQDDMGKLLRNIAYMKHEDWGYEKEWRIHRPHESNEGNYNDWPEDPRVFGAIYFGCRINKKEAILLTKLINIKYPHMEIYQAKPSATGFKIEYQKVK